MNSLIIPCYNSRKTIQRLLDTVPKDVEVIIVEDGSTEPIDPPDCIYIKQENQGCGGARNTGLKHASGDYVFFADADDELVDFDKWKDVLNHDVIYSVFADEYNGNIEYKSARVCGCIYAVAYRRKFLLDNNIWFPPHRLMEDISFNTKVYRKTDDWAVMKDDTYIRHVTPGSITSQKGYMIRELPDRVRYLSHLWDYLNGDEWIQGQINRSITCLYWIYMWADMEDKKEFWDEINALEAKTHFIDRLTDVEENLKRTRLVEQRLTPIKITMTFGEFLNDRTRYL